MEEIAHEENNFEKRESKRTSYPCQIQNTQSLQTLAEERSTRTALTLIERNRSLMIEDDGSDDGST